MRAIHHFDLWVQDPATATAEWNWLFGRCGWEVDFLEATGGAWKHPDGTYTFLERSPDLTDVPHDRLRPGINHLALTVADLQALDALRADAPGYGWSELFADNYPHAGGEDHTALYLENSEGFEVEVVAEATPAG
jgi:hypothetical protein